MNYPTFRRSPTAAPRIQVDAPKKRDAELGSKWARFASSYIRRNPFCAECQRRGVDTPTALVDHIIPRKKGGSMWDKSNLQSLCRDCDLGVKRELERLADAAGDVQLLVDWTAKPETRPGRLAFIATAVESD